MSVPLQVIYLSSDLITGTVTVGNRLTLPIKGISLTLGNDLASKKVILQLISDPELNTGIECSRSQYLSSLCHH